MKSPSKKTKHVLILEKLSFQRWSPSLVVLAFFVLTRVFSPDWIYSPKNSPKTSPEELNGRNGTMDPGEKACCFFFEKKVAFTSVHWWFGFLGSPKMKGIFASGYPDSRAPNHRDPNATCSYYRLDFSICYVQLWGKFMNSFCELFI